MSEPIFHLARAVDWAAALGAGDYRVSTLGRSLEDEGFLHASRAEQWEAVRERYYSGIDDDLVLLVIDPSRLESPVRVEAVPGTDETFPHVYGPLNLDAVVEVRPVE